MNPRNDRKPDKPKSSKHWILWTLVVLFIVGSITVMMLADYFFAPGSNGTVAEPKDAPAGS